LAQRVFIAGYYGFGNAGDEAILATMVQHLRELRPGLSITATSNTPAETAAAHGIDSILWTDVSAMLEAIRSAHLVLVGGGGIFHDYWGFNPNALLTDDHWGISFYTGPVLLGAILNKPVMLYAVGVGPLLSEHGRRYTRIACEVAQRVTVRDEGSLRLLADLGVPDDKAELTADPVFAFEVPDPERPAKPRVGVALRNWNLGIDPAFWEAEVARAFDQFLDAYDVELRFLPFQKLATELEDDAAIARRVQGRMRQQARTSLFEEVATPELLASEIAACELVVGMRLHAAILAAAARVPCLSLSYDPKVEQAMDRLSLGSYTVDIKAVEALSLAAVMGQAFERRQELRQQIAQALPALAAQSRRNATIALEVMDSGESGRLTPEALEALSRSYQTHLESSHQLRVENQRLFGEFEFYQKRSVAEQERADALAAELDNAGATGDELVDRIGALEIAKAEHEQHVADLTRTFELQKQNLERHQAELAGQIRTLEERLSQAEDLRGRVVRGLDQFHQTLTTNLETYRSQRAWRWMLWLRKAYWLNANRGFGAALGWMLRGSPDLEELELAFPQVWSYMPERLEVPLLEAPPTQTPTASPEASSSQPVRLADWLRPARYDVIILAIFDFEFRFQRPQQIAAELARRGHRVFWVSPARVLDPSSPQPFEAIPLRDNLWEIHLRGRKPELYTGTEPPDPALLDSLRALYRDFAIAGSCAVLQFPHWRQLGLGLRSEFGARLVYDCMDDWQNWTAEPRISDFNLAEERALSRDADVLVVTSQEFLERQEAAGLNPHPVSMICLATCRSRSSAITAPSPIGSIATWSPSSPSRARSIRSC
jgi:polysaccharide pyruvyl transferase CsaB